MKCRGKCEIPFIGMNRQAKNNRLYISVIDPIEACINIRTDRYKNLTNGTARFMAFDRPKDQMNCPEPLCVTTGTLYVKPTDGETVATLTYEREDYAIDYVNGVVSYYAVLPNEKVELTVSITDKANGATVTFTDVYEKGAPRTVLVQHALDEANTVLPATENGLKLTVSIKSAGEVGISSLSMVQDKADFEMNEVIAFTCIDELDFPTEVDLTDPTCLGQDIDEESISLEMTVTAQQVTGNFMRLNSLIHETNETEFFEVRCIKKAIHQVTVNGTNYQGIRLPNYYTKECGFVTAYLPACDALEGYLKLNTIANGTKPDLQSFKVLVDATTGYYYAIFADTYQDVEVTVSYPRTRSAKVYEANTDFVEGRRIRLVAPFEYKNGQKGYYMSEDAFVTSFPFGWSSSDNTPLEFNITFKKREGRFYKVIVFDKQED